MLNCLVSSEWNALRKNLNDMVEDRRVFLSIFKAKQSWARCQRWSLSQKPATRSDNQKVQSFVVFWRSISCEHERGGGSSRMLAVRNIMSTTCWDGKSLRSAWFRIACDQLPSAASCWAAQQLVSIQGVGLTIELGSVRSTLETLFRCFELSEQSTGFFSTILIDQCTNASLPPWPNAGLSMLEKHWINELRLRVLRFCEVACWQDWSLWWRKNYRPAQNSMYWSDHAQVAIEIPGHYCDALLTTSISLVAGFKAACIAAMTRHAASVVQRVRGYEVHPRDWGLGAARSQF